jgi:antitoxin HicB
VTYHFRIHDGAVPWAECVELNGCITQGKNRLELERNMKEALHLYLEEPETSTIVFPPPLAKVTGRKLAPVEVDPAVAFAVQLRQLRIANRLTQKEAAKLLGMKCVFSYQRLEKRSNPSLATLRKVKGLFPGFSLDMIIGG